MTRKMPKGPRYTLEEVMKMVEEEPDGDIDDPLEIITAGSDEGFDAGYDEGKKLTLESDVESLDESGKKLTLESDVESLDESSETNKYAQETMNPLRYEKWKPLSTKEYEAYLGFTILIGINSLPSLDDYWRKNPIDISR